MIKIEIIGKIKTPFRDKFGIPRQSGMVDGVISTISFTPKYRNKYALRGLEGFSHIWVIWEFSEFKSEEWSPTVRPPRLGGNTRMGVFATRSPNRPNPIGLSCLKLIKVDLESEDSPLLVVSGADMLDGTPIYDIKPYIPFTDAHPDARFGFAESYVDYKLQVEFKDGTKDLIEDDKKEHITELLSLDPRPSYHYDPERIYIVTFYDYEIKFKVSEKRLTVVEVNKK